MEKNSFRILGGVPVYVLIGNSDTILLLFRKGHVDKPVSSDGMFNMLERSS